MAFSDQSIVVNSALGRPVWPARVLLGLGGARQGREARCVAETDEPIAVRHEEAIATSLAARETCVRDPRGTDPSLDRK